LLLGAAGPIDQSGGLPFPLAVATRGTLQFR